MLFEVVPSVRRVEYCAVFPEHCDGDLYLFIPKSFTFSPRKVQLGHLVTKHFMGGAPSDRVPGILWFTGFLRAVVWCGGD